MEMPPVKCEAAQKFLINQMLCFPILDRGIDNITVRRLAQIILEARPNESVPQIIRRRSLDFLFHFSNNIALFP